VDQRTLWEQLTEYGSQQQPCGPHDEPTRKGFEQPRNALRNDGSAVDKPVIDNGYRDPNEHQSLANVKEQ
jgi:hypothetical protein